MAKKSDGEGEAGGTAVVPSRKTEWETAADSIREAKRTLLSQRENLARQLADLDDVIATAFGADARVNGSAPRGRRAGGGAKRGRKAGGGKGSRGGGGAPREGSVGAAVLKALEGGKPLERAALITAVVKSGASKSKGTVGVALSTMTKKGLIKSAGRGLYAKA